MNDDELDDDELYEYDTIDYNFFFKKRKKNLYYFQFIA